MARSNAERQQAYRDRKKAAKQDGQEETTPPEPPPEEDAPIVQSEVYEQMVRDRWGYSKSEKRTQAERQAVADRIVKGAP